MIVPNVVPRPPALQLDACYQLISCQLYDRYVPSLPTVLSVCTLHTRSIKVLKTAEKQMKTNVFKMHARNGRKLKGVEKHRGGGEEAAAASRRRGARRRRRGGGSGAEAAVVRRRQRCGGGGGVEAAHAAATLAHCCSARLSGPRDSRAAAAPKGRSPHAPATRRPNPHRRDTCCRATTQAPT